MEARHQVWTPLATAAILAAVLCWPAGIALGHLALGRARRESGAGQGVAVLALVVAYTLALVTVLLVIDHFGRAGPARLT